MSPIVKCVKFLSVRKKFWLPPFLIVTLLLVGALLLAKGPAIAPFIYRPV